MMVLLLIFQTTVDFANGSAEKFLYGAGGAGVSTVLYWWLTRGKVGAETDRSYQQMALEVANDLAAWIEKFKTAKEEMIAVVHKAGELQQALDACTEERDDCRDLLVQAKQLIEQFEVILKDLIEHNHLLDDLIRVKRRVSRFIDPPPPHQTDS